MNDIEYGDYTAVFITKLEDSYDTINEDYYTGDLSIVVSGTKTGKNDNLICDIKTFKLRSETGLFPIFERYKSGPFSFLGMGSLVDFEEKYKKIHLHLISY